MCDNNYSPKIQQKRDIPGKYCNRSKFSKMLTTDVAAEELPSDPCRLENPLLCNTIVKVAKSQSC